MIKRTQRSLFQRRRRSWGLPVLALAALVAASALLYRYLVGPGREEASQELSAPASEVGASSAGQTEIAESQPSQPEDAGAPPLSGEASAPLPALDESDPMIRKLAADITARPELRAWLAGSDLVRRFVAAVANVADGESPRQHLRFLTPKQPFRVIEQEDRVVADPRSYARYDVVADVFASLRVARAAAVYRSAQPLFEQAFAALGIPERSFDETLELAIRELLQTPPIEGAVELRRVGPFYEYPDEALEALSPAQRHLLRTGPRNALQIQAKLREIQRALGFEDS